MILEGREGAHVEDCDGGSFDAPLVARASDGLGNVFGRLPYYFRDFRAAGDGDGDLAVMGSGGGDGTLMFDGSGDSRDQHHKLPDPAVGAGGYPNRRSSQSAVCSMPGSFNNFLDDICMVNVADTAPQAVVVPEIERFWNTFKGHAGDPNNPFK
ncbi:hypothetical protein GGX14DRAFT_406142 [Mycena pura]|uniref:Uncharacterized protein n=1 Tax=Mycena pura TaxID=153505 RepID=A0AAD6UQH2_9AGAR|nr:hypothetical protein GGX14DRAFT_406142 [Mycena pura]